MKYVLIDLERSMIQRRLIFWKPNRHGYTEFSIHAGLYSEDEAREIVENDIDELTLMVKDSTLKNITP